MYLFTYVYVIDMDLKVDDDDVMQVDQMADNGEFSFTNKASGVNLVDRSRLPRIHTHVNKNGICHDDSAQPVKAQTIDELHSLQKKKSAPTTPIKDSSNASTFSVISEEERQKLQLQSIRHSSYSSSFFFFLARLLTFICQISMI